MIEKKKKRKGRWRKRREEHTEEKRKEGRVKEREKERRKNKEGLILPNDFCQFKICKWYLALEKFAFAHAKSN